MVFVELMDGFRHVYEPSMALESLPNDSLFLIDSSDPWYGDIHMYLQTE